MAAKNTKRNIRSLLLRTRAARAGNREKLPEGDAATTAPGGELFTTSPVPVRKQAGTNLQAIADKLRARLAGAVPAAAAPSFSTEKIDITKSEFRGRQPKGTPQVINRQPRPAQKPEGRPSSALLEFAAASQKEKPLGMAKAAPAPEKAAAPMPTGTPTPDAALSDGTKFWREQGATKDPEETKFWRTPEAKAAAEAAAAAVPRRGDTPAVTPAAPMPTGTPTPDATLSDGRRFWREQEAPKPAEPTKFWRTPEAEAAAVAAAARATPPGQQAPAAAEKPGTPSSRGAAAAPAKPAPAAPAKPAPAAPAKPAPAAPAKPARTGKEINWYNADTKSNELSVPPADLQEIGIRGGAEGGTSIPIYAKVYDSPQQKEAARQREAQRQAQALVAYRARQARISPDARGSGMLRRMRAADTINRARR